MKKVTFLVPEYQDLVEENKIAILTAYLTHSSPLVAQHKFQDALSNAVTEWIKTTAEGKKFYENWSGCVSLSAIMNEQPFSHLFTTILAKHGIKDMKIDILKSDGDNCWHLGDVLIDRSTIKE